jgi:ATP-binding cassette subfamily B protein
MHLLIPWFTRLALDGLSTARDHGWDLLRFPLLIVLAASFQGVFRYFWRTNVFGFSRNIEWDVRNALFAHLQRLPLSYFQHTKTGDLMSRLTNDLASVREMLGIGAVAALDGAVLILAALPLMIGIDPWLTLWSLLSLPGITLLVLRFGDRIHQGYREVQQFLGRVSIFVQENLAGIRVVQAHAQEENQMRRFAVLSAEYMRKNLVTARLSGLLWPLMAVFSGLAAAIVLWLGGRRVLLGQLTIGQFVQFNGYLAMLTWPVMAVGYVVNLYQRGSSALTRLVEILETPVAAGHLTPEDGSPRRLQGEIEFRGLSYRYHPEGPWVLRDISLRIPAGTRLPSWARAPASTLVSLIRGSSRRPRSLFLVGRTSDDSAFRLKASIGLVSQDIFLFSRPSAASCSPSGCHRRDWRRRPDRGDPAQHPGVHRSVRHPPGRAGRSPLGGAEAADGAGPRPDQEPAHSDPGRCLLQRGRPDGGAHPARAEIVHGRPDDGPHLAPDLHGEGRGPDHIPEGWPDRGARDPPGAPGPRGHYHRLQRQWPAS